MLRPATLALALAGLLAGCAAGQSGAGLPAPIGGEQLYRSHCAACHRLRDPAEQTREGWARAVQHYGPRAHLGPADQARVLAWLQGRAADVR
jgi:mono/diheme cytochrome c family protein